MLIYKKWKKMPGYDHAFSAGLALSFIFGLIGVSVLLLGHNYLFKFLSNDNWLIVGSLSAIIILFNYFLFSYKERYKNIELFYDELSEKIKKRNKLLFISVIIGTISLLVYTLSIV